MGVKLRVGVIGAGEVAQIVHLPTLLLMSHLYTTTAVCDASAKTAAHCAEKFHIPLATTDASLVYKSAEVDVVFVLTSDEHHEPYVIAALQAGKHVMVEKPLTLSIQSGKRILAVQAESKKIVFVGYMRRYTPALEAFKREVASIPRINYARVRDFPGPNPAFVAQSGAFVVRNNDYPAGSQKARDDMIEVLVAEALHGKTATSREGTMFCRFMNTLGSHDISLMREVLGKPDRVMGVSVNDPVYTALFEYQHKTGTFAVNYESGWDDVPDFDAHLAIYGQNKRVTIKYDSPFVKGLAIKVSVQERNEHGDMLETREIISSYEDAYTAELQELYKCIVEGKSVKTPAEDALEDLEIYDMMYEQWEKQSKT